MNHTGQLSLKSNPLEGDDNPLGNSTILSETEGAYRIRILENTIKQTLSAVTKNDGQHLQGANVVMKDILLFSYFDSVTGLPNGEKFSADYRESTPKLSRSIAILSINAMCDINNTYGVNTGNIIIQQIALILALYAQENDLAGVRLYKLQGPNFAIVYEGNQGELFILADYQRLQAQLLKVKYLGIPLSFSLGIALDEANSELLLDHGLMALQQSKITKKPITYDDSMDTRGHSVELLKMQSLVNEAFDNGLFEVYFQPIVPNDSSGIDQAALNRLQEYVGPDNGPQKRYESLVRMQDPRDVGKLIFPTDFLSVIDIIGRNPDLTTIVVKKVCEAYIANPGHYSINLTADDLNIPGRAMQIFEQINAYNISPSHIGIEILEGIPELLPVMLENIEKFHALGFEISIDDVGSGFSNLTRISQFHAHNIKIDRGLIHRIDKNPVNRIIVEGLIKMAHALKIKVVAEGIETLEEHKILEGLGADFFQGFLFGQPISFPKKSSIIIDNL